jgi:hypothetical protein
MDGKPVVIRTGLGADRRRRRSCGGNAESACLIRLPPERSFCPLRAMRASKFGKIRIAMLAHAHEIDQSLAMVKQARRAGRRDIAATTERSGAA